MMNKQLRQQVYDKYNGLCAYTGKPLDENWQVDHMTSKRYNEFSKIKINVNSIENLLPAISFVNHYKRDYDLEGFRTLMRDFHKRLAKLPKKTNRPATVKRIAYMNNIANLFDITIDKPFSGKFYFETIE